MRWIAGAWCLLAGFAASPGLACGDSTNPCQLAGGQYYAALPTGADRPPVVIWLHGYAASGRATIASEHFVTAARERGYAVIAPDGQVNTLQGSQLDWGVEDGFDLPRDDIGFLQRVKDDAVARFGLDETRILLAGYSRGGGMVWDLACAEPGFAAAYAAHAGGFWEPLPADCAGPVHLLHSHGFVDNTLPPEGSGMTFYGTEFEVGDIFEGLKLWRRTMACPAKASESAVSPAMWVKHWSTCPDGSLRFELLPSGHNRRPDWPGAAIDWAESQSSG